MRSFRKPGRYKRNLHSTYCREHPLVKSSSNIYSFLLKGLFLIAREVSPKKRNNIPFITWNFRGKRVRGDEAATTPFTCPFTSIIVWTASTILKFIVATFPKSVRIFSFDHYLFVIRRDTQLRSILILFSAVLCYVLRSHLRSIHPSLSIPLDKRWARHHGYLLNSNVAVFLIIPAQGGEGYTRVSRSEISCYEARDLLPIDH